MPAEASTVLGDTLLLGDAGRALERGTAAHARTVLGDTLHLRDTRRALE